MKATKYLAIIIAVVAVLATTVWYLRDSIIQRLSGPILARYDLTLTYVSLDALARDDATISLLELEHAKGTSIAIEGLTLPLGTRPDAIRTYAARKVTIITATRTEGEPFEMASLMDQYFSLADTLPNTEVVVNELRVAPYPAMRDVRWISKDDRQTLQATIEGNTITTQVLRAAQGVHTGSVGLVSARENTTPQSVDLRFERVDSGIMVTGASTVELLAWTPLLELFELMPGGVDFESGTAEIGFSAEVPYDSSITPSLSAQVTQAAPLRLAYINSTADKTSVLVQSGSPYQVSATFPKVEWTVRQDRSRLLVTYEDWREIPVSISALSCESGITCTMNSAVEIAAAKLPIGSAGQVRLTSRQNVAIAEDETRVQVQPDAELQLVDFSSPAANLAQLDVQFVSGISLQLSDAGWKFAAESADAKIEKFAVTGDAAVSAPVFLENVLASSENERLSVQSGVYAPSSQATLATQTVALPGIRGRLLFEGNEVVADLETVGLDAEAKIGARHSLASGRGNMSLNGATLSFAKMKLSKRVRPWRKNWDFSAGTIAVDLNAAWGRSAPANVVTGQSSIRVKDLAGIYTDTAFTGLSTSLDARYDKATGIAVAPSSITVRLLEIGVPVENISADYRLDIANVGVDVENLRMSAFGGLIRADPFSFHTARDSNTLILRAEAVELARLLAANELETVTVTGRVGAELPILIEGDTITITNGTLTGDPPGGVIRYRGGGAQDVADTSGIGIATRALSNFVYETLNSTVMYSKEGDLILQTRLTGRNPDLKEKRPIILNLALETNVPQMLRSLQAARSVEEILEKRLAK